MTDLELIKEALRLVERSISASSYLTDEDLAVSNGLNFLRNKISGLEQTRARGARDLEEYILSHD